MLVLASCGGGDDTEPTTPGSKPPSSETRGIVLRLDRPTTQPGETLTLTVENRTRTRLEYGLAYRLEQRTEDGWRWINRDSAFILILKGVEAGRREREEIRLPNRLEPGRYRIVKLFTAPATGRELRALVEFSVS